MKISKKHGSRNFKDKVTVFKKQAQKVSKYLFIELMLV